MQAGHREDRSLDLLRRRQHLRVGALLGDRIRSGASPTRCGATPASCARTTPSRCCSTPSTTGATATSSTPTRSAGSPTARSPTRARPTSTGTRCGTCRPATSTAAGPSRWRSRSSRCATSPGRDQTWGINLRRVVRWKNEWSYLAQVPRALTTFRGILKVSSAGTLVGLQAPVGQPQPRAQAVRARRASPPTAPSTPPSSNDGDRPRRRRRQVRRHAEPHRRPHRQHRLRAGRGRRAAGQPDPLQPVLPREARLLPRGPRHVRVRRPGQRRPRRRQRRHAVPVLQPPHRPRRRSRVIPLRAGGRLTGKAGTFTFGALNVQTGDDDARGVESRQLHRAARQARHPAAQQHRRHVHASHGDARAASAANDGYGVDAAFVVLSRTSASTPTWPAHADRGPRRRRPQLSRLLRLQRRPLRRAGSSGWWSSRTSCPRSASCAAPTCAATSASCASVRGRRTSRTCAS